MDPMRHRPKQPSPLRPRFTTRLQRHLALASIALLVSAASLWGQSAPGGSPPFGSLNSSLDQAADSVLLSARKADMAAHPRMHTASPTLRYGGGADHPMTGAAFSRVAQLRPVLDPILHAAGVPTRLDAVVLVESGGDPMALSPRGARGLWQLMPDTARRYGLIVSESEDDRLDIEKSTAAAADYLRDLHREFGSWRLALAAYNTGERNLQHAIERSESRNFEVLSAMRLLPLETRDYVPAVLAAEGQFSDSGLEPRAAAQERAESEIFAVADASD